VIAYLRFLSGTLGLAEEERGQKKVKRKESFNPEHWRTTVENNIA
jgi:hypothetical protein